jgi:hypothetical protein
MDRRLSRRQVGKLIGAGVGVAASGFPNMTSASHGPATAWYFAEGWTGPGFDQFLVILNPHVSSTAQVRITYYKTNGTQVLFPPNGQPSLSLPAKNRVTFNVRDHLGNDIANSAKVESTNGVGIVVERPMYFNYNGVWNGGHNVLGATEGRSLWYFAEGYTATGFDEYLCIFNPTNVPANVRITYYLASGGPVVKTIGVGSTSRFTVAVHDTAFGVGRNQAVSVKVETTNEFAPYSGAVPIVVERPMYFDYNSIWTGGHNIMGAGAPQTTWYFAAGSTETNYDTYLSILNPNSSDAGVTIAYYGSSSVLAVKSLTVPANRRSTVAVHETQFGVGRGHRVAAKVTTTHSGGIVVERPMYFTYNGVWTGGHSVVGSAAPLLTWQFAEGYTGAGFDEYLTIFNPTAITAGITITYYQRPAGGGSWSTTTKFLSVGGLRRTHVAVHDSLYGVGRNWEVSAQVATDGVPVVVERPMYFNYGAGGWTGGHNIVGYGER